MTTKEKARELVHKMYVGFVHDLHSYKAKQCALICVDELIKNEFDSDGIPYKENNIYYWQEVKEEINKL